MLRIVSTLVLSAAGLTIVGSSPPEQDGSASAAAAAEGRDAEADVLLATWLLTDNELEAELARIGSQHAEDPALKELALRLVADREAFGRVLEPFSARVKIPGVIDAGAQRSGEGAGFDHVALLEELGTQFLQTARNQLQGKDAAELDRWYADQAIAGQLRLQDMMQVFEQHASGKLRSAIQADLPVVQEDLRRAQDAADALRSR